MEPGVTHLGAPTQVLKQQLSRPMAAGLGLLTLSMLAWFSRMMEA